MINITKAVQEEAEEVAEKIKIKVLNGDFAGALDLWDIVTLSRYVLLIKKAREEEK